MDLSQSCWIQVRIYKMENVYYGSELAKEIRGGLKEKVDVLKQEGKRIPCLAVILVGNNPASLSYVKGKEKACASVGIESKFYHLEETATQEEVEETIEQCNNDEEVDGILVQLPLPSHLNETSALLKIDPKKDVDGLHPLNVGNLYSGQPGFVPCTPLGIMELLKYMNCEIDGKTAVVIGRSNLVGAPVARLLQNENATVTVCHSHTKNMEEVCRQADILVVAMGKEKFVNHTFVKEGAYVIDVGINRMEDGKLCGDVDFEDVKEHVRGITPVPKGVGPMTICMLLSNTMRAYEEREK